MTVWREPAWTTPGPWNCFKFEFLSIRTLPLSLLLDHMCMPSISLSLCVSLSLHSVSFSVSLGSRYHEINIPLMRETPVHQSLRPVANPGHEGGLTNACCLIQADTATRVKHASINVLVFRSTLTPCLHRKHIRVFFTCTSHTTDMLSF